MRNVQGRGSGPRRRGAEAPRRSFRPEARGARPCSAPRRASANPDQTHHHPGQTPVPESPETGLAWGPGASPGAAPAPPARAASLRPRRGTRNLARLHRRIRSRRPCPRPALSAVPTSSRDLSSTGWTAALLKGRPAGRSAPRRLRAIGRGPLFWPVFAGPRWGARGGREAKPVPPTGHKRAGSEPRGAGQPFQLRGSAVVSPFSPFASAGGASLRRRGPRSTIWKDPTGRVREPPRS